MEILATALAASTVVLAALCASKERSMRRMQEAHMGAMERTFQSFSDAMASRSAQDAVRAQEMRKWAESPPGPPGEDVYDPVQEQDDEIAASQQEATDEMMRILGAAGPMPLDRAMAAANSPLADPPEPQDEILIPASEAI